MDTTAMCQAMPTHTTDLPVELLASILECVPMPARLSTCALVCRNWAAAAMIATPHVKCSFHPDSLPNFQDWLAVYSTQLHSLEYTSGMGHRYTLQLSPGYFPQLQQLTLKFGKIHIELGPSTDAAAAAAGHAAVAANDCTQNVAGPLLPMLRHLNIPSSRLPSPASLLQLVLGAKLTSLDISSIRFQGTEDYKPLNADVEQQLQAALTQLLQQLPGLHVLDLAFVNIGPEAAQHLKAITGLQDLSLDFYAGMTSDILQDLAGSITRLDLSGWRQSDPVEGQPAPWESLPARLQQFTGLLHLQLHCCKLPPTLLASLGTQLQHLELDHCPLLPAEPQDKYHRQGTAALLAALSKLTRLEHLSLVLPELDTVSQPLASYAAITASTQLTKLEVSSDEEVQPLPRGAVQYMFPASKRLPYLEELTVNSDIEDSRFSQVPEWHALDGQDLSRILSCCPNLHELDIHAAVSEGSDLSALLQLPPTCSSLRIGGLAFGDAAAPIVAQLVQLRELQWYASPGLTDLGAERLTNLTALTSLKMNDCMGLSEEMQDEDMIGNLEIQQYANEPPAYIQLQQLCATSPVIKAVMAFETDGHSP